MDGILIINKDKNVTSRDVVNELIKKFKIKKIGHTGTLDPIATGVLVVCVGKATKLVQELTCNDKEYIATVELGTLTDTLDSTGKILKEEKVFKTKKEIVKILDSFKCTYNQEVPKYSAVKINGKKLYEYARQNIDIELPKREVTISNIVLIGDIINENNKCIFKFKCTVSKGTYIRSLINDISNKLNTIGIMTGLERVRQGKFNIDDSKSVAEVGEKDLINIIDVLDYPKIEITDKNSKAILNGAIIDSVCDEDKVVFIKGDIVVAIYKKYKENKMKPYIMFKGGII